MTNKQIAGTAMNREYKRMQAFCGQGDSGSAFTRTEAIIAQRRANAPLLPKVAQVPRHELGGLFDDTHNQLDLIDAINRRQP